MEQYSLGVPIRFFSPVDTCRQQQPRQGSAVAPACLVLQHLRDGGVIQLPGN